MDRENAVSFGVNKKPRFSGANPGERRAHMDMENEKLETGAAGEVVTPETETEEREPAAEAEGEKGNEIAEHSTETGKQTHEERTQYKAARRQGERTGYDRANKENNARIAKMGLIDPMTNKPITTMAELESYGQRAKQHRLEARAKEEKKTLAQVEEEDAALELLHQKRREDAERERKAQEEQAKREWMEQDAEAFAEQYPDVDPGQLENDAKFKRFCGKRLYNEPLAELYEDYLAVVGEAARTAQVKREDKAERGTGSGGGAGSKVMTAKQRRELEAWNEANPHMRMNEKEFLSFK